MNVLVIPEDFRKDQYVLKQIIQKMMRAIGLNARVSPVAVARVVIVFFERKARATSPTRGNCSPMTCRRPPGGGQTRQRLGGEPADMPCGFTSTSSIRATYRRSSTRRPEACASRR